MPYLAMVVIPHPLGGLRPEEVEAKARSAVQDIVLAISLSLEELKKRSTSLVGGTLPMASV